MGVLNRLFSYNERELARYRKTVEVINGLEPRMRRLSDRQLSAMTGVLKGRLSQGETVDDILPEAYATGREAARRVLGERPFDVQLVGGIALHEGRIAEMKTGEGKTLTATMPLYLNALTGRGVHLVTTNDFLVKWQAEWMGQLYQFLGLTVGFIQHDMPPWVRAEMHRADVTYIQNSELGFDYLRDNMALDREQLVLGDLYYSIVDEVDSILIDEARTPLILSGAGEQSTDLYRTVNAVTARLQAGSKDEDGTEHGDYIVDEKLNTCHLTESGQAKVEQALNVSNIAEEGALEIQHHIQASLKAHTLFHRDKEYIVKNGEVVIVDEFTGHLQPGRRYSDGIHQSIEAKEGVRIREEQQTMATITYQNFFRLYEKLAGMTGTAKTEEAEFQRIYNMPVMVIPPNRPVQRLDHSDVVYKTQEAKFRGIVADLVRAKTQGQPVLVGTRNVEVSELIARRLLKSKVQLLALVAVLQDDINARKDISKQDREEWLQALRLPLDSQMPTGTEEFRYETEDADDEDEKSRTIKTLQTAQATRIARNLGLEPDPLHATNLERLTTVWQLVDEDAPIEERSAVAGRLSDVLREEKAIQPLNAKFHAQEADVIRDAGKAGMVTIATNMAGRGVDIALGGAAEEGEDRSAEYEEVKALGGLHVLGTERHESRRIDNQLRGRSGRQGDPGSSRFYVSLEDELMRIFAPERMRFLTGSWPEEEPVETKLITKTLERAQHKVEIRNFGIRKHTLQYDNVMNEQRTVVYDNRRRVLMGEDVRDSIVGMTERVAEAIVKGHANPDVDHDEWDIEGMLTSLRESIPGLVERMAGHAVQGALARAFPGCLAESACALLDADRQWLARAAERAVRDAGAGATPGELVQIAESLAPGVQGIIGDDDLSAMEPNEQVARVATAAREAVEQAAEPTRDALADAVGRLPLADETDPDRAGIPESTETCLQAAELLAEARVAMLTDARKCFERATIPDPEKDSLVAGCSERIEAAEAAGGLADRLCRDASERTVARILVDRAGVLYADELTWHDRAFESRLADVLRLHANPEKPMDEWDLNAVRRDAETTIPGMAQALTDEFLETADPIEFAETVRQIGAELLTRRDQSQATQRLETLNERVMTATRAAAPSDVAPHRWSLDVFFIKAGEAEGEMRALLAEEAVRRVRNSRLPSELKNPAGSRYQDRALAVRGSWGLRRAFALEALRQIPENALTQRLQERALTLYEAREGILGASAMRQLERGAMLRSIEASWPQHLRDMDHLNEAIRLRAYGQKDPLVEYQRESYGYFQRLLDKIAQDVTKLVYGSDFVARPARRRARPAAPARSGKKQKQQSKRKPGKGKSKDQQRPDQLPRPDKRCWCGGGKKYKNCHMAEDQAAVG